MILIPRLVSVKLTLTDLLMGAGLICNNELTLTRSGHIMSRYSVVHYIAVRGRRATGHEGWGVGRGWIGAMRWGHDITFPWWPMSGNTTNKQNFILGKRETIWHCDFKNSSICTNKKKKDTMIPVRLYCAYYWFCINKYQDKYNQNNINQQTKICITGFSAVNVKVLDWWTCCPTCPSRDVM